MERRLTSLFCRLITSILPEFSFTEIEKYKNVLSNSTKLSNAQFIEWTCFVFSKITIFPSYILTTEVVQKSEVLLKKIDIKDVAYVAMAMQLSLILITRDNVLYKGLKQKGFRKVLLFEDFLNTI